MDSSRSLLQGALIADKNSMHIDKYLQEQVLHYMRSDDLLKVIRSDTLILQFGLAQLRRIGVGGRQRIAGRMRLLARLLLTLRKTLHFPTQPLSFFLNSVYFDGVIEAIEALCGLHSNSDGQRTFKTPSVALAIGNVLPKCCHIKKACPFVLLMMRV